MTATLNKEAAGGGTEAADPKEKITNLTHHHREKTDFKEVSSLGNSHGKSLHELEQECLEFMAAQGLPFDGPIIAEGKLRRYSSDEKKSQRDEWYVAFDGVSSKGNHYLNCAFGTWSGGEKFIFNSWTRDKTTPKGELDALKKQWAAQKKQAEELRAEDEKQRIAKAKSDWDSSSDQPNNAVSYLERKKIKARGGRFSRFGFSQDAVGTWIQDETLLIPLRNIAGELRAVQHIRADGEKRIYGQKRGNFFQLGEITDASRILVTEGYATGISVHEQTGDPLVVALDCGNLDPVIASLRGRYKKNQILILGDDDIETVDKRTGELRNPGRSAAETAAKKYGCRVAFPKFSDDFRFHNGKRPTDWNDLLVHIGADELKRQLSEITSADLSAPEKPAFSPEELQKALGDNECGDANLFRTFSNGDVLFDPSEKSFYIWSRSLWVRDEEKWGRQKLQAIAECYTAEADRVSTIKEEPSPDEKKLMKALRKRGEALKTKRRMTDVLDMATTGSYGKGGLTYLGEWDNHPGFIPCANGLLQISSGDLLQPERSHFIRKSSKTNFKPSSSSDEFHSFVVEIMNGSKTKAEFLRRFLGYAALGHPVEDRFLFLYGKHGRNGKGTLVRCISSVLGDLARTFSPELILLQRNPPSSSTPRPDLIHLKGTRLAIFSEINEGRQIDSATLKNLTGRDVIAARSLFSNDVKNFSPTHSIVLQANHKPDAPPEDQALWYRALLVPFELSFVNEPKQPHERKADRHLEERLLANPSGIVRWIVEGAQEYLRIGLSIPKEISQATESYRQENDGIGTFLREKCVLDKTLSSKKEQTTKAIQDFCVSSEFKKPTRNKISDYLRKEGFEERHDRMGDRWIGFSIQPEQDEN